MVIITVREMRVNRKNAFVRIFLLQYCNAHDKLPLQGGIITMTVGERIKARRKELDISADFLADALNISRSTMYRYENGFIEKLPTDIIEPLAKALRTTPAYLMGWADEADRRSSLSLPGIEPPPRTVKKPLLGTIACGEPILAVENIEDYIDVPEKVRCDFTLRCQGNSMTGARIMDGDIVYIRQEPVENGEIAAVLLDGADVTLKRVYKSGDIITLQAENPAFAPITITSDRQFSVLGKAVGFTSLIK